MLTTIFTNASLLTPLVETPSQTSGSFFGTIETPEAIKIYGENGGLITLGNNIIILAVIIGGIITLSNVVQAGYIYLSAAGDTKAHEKVLGKITMSLWGMAIMILAPAMMAVFGFLFFKDSTFFLQPRIQGVEAPPAKKDIGDQFQI